MPLDTGCLQVYTGNGKGKTTAAIGLGVRGAGGGLKVVMVQFMKGRRYSEIEVIERMDNFEVYQHGRDEFVNREDPEQVDIRLAQGGLEHAAELIGGGAHDIVILDEINVACDFGLIDKEEVLRIIRDRPPNMEVVLTGRYAPEEFIEAADLVTEMREIKHHYQRGVQARKGIEY